MSTSSGVPATARSMTSWNWLLQPKHVVLEIGRDVAPPARRARRAEQHVVRGRGSTAVPARGRRQMPSTKLSRSHSMQGSLSSSLSTCATIAAWPPCPIRVV